MSRSSTLPSTNRKQSRLAILRSFRRRVTSQLQHPGSEGSPLEPTSPQAADAKASLTAVLCWGAVAFFLLAVTRRGWISDDGFITMRAVDHLIDGRGFVYNADERVLGFTNPLWALLMAVPYLVLRDPYMTPIVGSIAVSGITAAYLVFRGAKDHRVGALLLLALTFSRSFVDFSTSGLENPLSHLLLVLFYVEFFSEDRFSIGRLSLFAGLLLVNRFDLLPLYLPPLVMAYRQRMASTDRRSVALGWLPAIGWFAFAIVYYGFPLPNTAYAKLNAEIPQLEMIRQGLSYLADALVNDPQSAILILAAIVVLWTQRGKHPTANVVLLAVVLELVYVVFIGGDFMSGRFLTPTIAVSAIVLAAFAGPWLVEPGRLSAATLVVVGVILCLAFSPLRDEPVREKRDFPVTRIVNERAWFQEFLLLHLNIRPVQWQAYGLYGDGKTARAQQRRVVLYNNVGMYAWGAGPDIHVVDEMALTDPLLARIPFAYRDDWRTGHLPRVVPDGYLESLEKGRNLIRDPCIAEYFARLDAVVRGPLFTAERWAAILTLNLPGGMTVRACPERIAAPPAPPPAVPAAEPPQVPAEPARPELSGGSSGPPARPAP